jgi:hypothetical protein
MTCNKCGAAVTAKNIPEAEDKGRFVEEWECANGHSGFVRGREEQPPQEWNRFGAIYDADY